MKTDTSYIEGIEAWFLWLALQLFRPLLQYCKHSCHSQQNSTIFIQKERLVIIYAFIYALQLIFPGKPPNTSGSPAPAANPFADQQPPKPTINQIKQAPFAAPAQQFGTSAPSSYGFSGSPYSGTNGQYAASSTFGASTGNIGSIATPAVNDPWAPVAQNSPWVKSSEPANPFLS